MKLLATFPAVVNPLPVAYIIACYDPRIEESIYRFIGETLGIPPGKRILKKIGGGAAPLAHPRVTKSRCKGLARQMEFAFRKFPFLEEGIFMGHEDCAYYSELPAQCQGHDKEERDLGGASNTGRAIIYSKPVRSYFIKLVDEGRKADFYQVEVPHRRIILPPGLLRSLQYTS